MIQLIKDALNPRPENYSIDEITQRLESKKSYQISKILELRTSHNAEQIAAKLKINRRSVFKHIEGIKRKSIKVVSFRPIKCGVQVIDLETGIIFDSIPAAAKAFNKPIRTMRDYTYGRRKTFTRWVALK